MVTIWAKIEDAVSNVPSIYRTSEADNFLRADFVAKIKILF